MIMLQFSFTGWPALCVHSDRYNIFDSSHHCNILTWDIVDEGDGEGDRPGDDHWSSIGTGTLHHGQHLQGPILWRRRHQTILCQDALHVLWWENSSLINSLFSPQRFQWRALGQEKKIYFWSAPLSFLTLRVVRFFLTVGHSALISYYCIIILPLY